MCGLAVACDQGPYGGEPDVARSPALSTSAQNEEVGHDTPPTFPKAPMSKSEFTKPGVRPDDVHSGSKG